MSTAQSTPTPTVSERPSANRAEDPKSSSSAPPNGHSHTKDFGIIPIPRRLQYDPDQPFQFGLVLNIAFGIASTFTVANLYYCQPLLIQFSQSFNVTYSEVSRIPTLIQAGYATGLLLIAPLGDLLRRRQLILTLITLSTTLTIGLAVTNKLVAFEVLCFLVGMCTVTPQIMIPLAADLAPPERRASAISVVLSGLLLGILVARVLAGVVAQFITWRVVYYLAIGTQACILFGSYLVIPDYPPKNAHLTYFDILWTMAKFAVTEPLLIQCCLINLTSSACFSNYWVTLTFLLGGPPYNYSTLVIGLFGLIGIFGVVSSPFVGRFIDTLVPWYSCLVATLGLLASQVIETGGGGINISTVVISTIGLDIFRQMQQVSLSTLIFTIDASAFARLNAVLIISIFIGQVLGTAAGTSVFVHHGWRADAALMLGWYGFQLAALLVRGPHCSRRTWFGYEGGFEARKKGVVEKKEPGAGVASTPSDIETGPPVDQVSSENEKQHHKQEKADPEESYDEKRNSSKPDGIA